MNILKFAAIDIGTNAVRLLFTHVIEDQTSVHFKKSSLIRVPLRLGFDVFQYGKIGNSRTTRLIETMRAFKHLMNAHNAEAYKACATSAMREATNGREIASKIFDATSIKIDIIDGQTEAKIIYANRIADIVGPDSSYLYVDIGGGSTELTIFHDHKIIDSCSFKIGTIRMLQLGVANTENDRMKDWIISKTEQYPGIKIIGSGGNVNKLFKLSEMKEGKPVPINKIEKVYKRLTGYTLDERIKILGMNPDRADVIIPATELFLQIMKWAESEEAVIPKFGLADGLIRNLYYDYKRITI